MVENPNNQPRAYDVVLGGNNPPTKVSSGSTGEQSSQSQPLPTQPSSIEKNSELERSTVGTGTFLRWVFWFVMTAFYFNNPETNGSPFESIANTCLIAWVIGLINPNWTIRFGLPKTRWTVTLVYLTIAAVYMVISS